MLLYITDLNIFLQLNDPFSNDKSLLKDGETVSTYVTQRAEFRYTLNYYFPFFFKLLYK